MSTKPLQGLARATFTLLVGGVMAQALPLLLGPLLTRLFSPAEFGLFHLFAAVAANAAVVACARFEFALPLAADEPEAQALRALCLRVLVGVVVGVVDESSARTMRRWLVLKRGWQVTSVRVATFGVLASTDVLSGATTETSLTV